MGDIQTRPLREQMLGAVGDVGEVGTLGDVGTVGGVGTVRDAGAVRDTGVVADTGAVRDAGAVRAGGAERNGAASDAYLFGPVVVKILHQEGEWKLTPHGQALGEAMVKARHCLMGKAVIEIGVGSGVHAITALKLGALSVDVTDSDPIALGAAEENASRNGVAYRNIWLRDWMNFEPDQPYDVVLCNPPFCKAGLPERRRSIKQLIAKSPRFLRPGGHLLMVQSSMANFALTERELMAAGFYCNAIHETRGFFRDDYFREPRFLEEGRLIRNGFEQIDGMYVETLRVYLGTKRE